jgi:hypothetical protein
MSLSTRQQKRIDEKSQIGNAKTNLWEIQNQKREENLIESGEYHVEKISHEIENWE